MRRVGYYLSLSEGKRQEERATSFLPVFAFNRSKQRHVAWFQKKQGVGRWVGIDTTFFLAFKAAEVFEKSPAACIDMMTNHNPSSLIDTDYNRIRFTMVY